jgi:hypothetical protein
MGGKGSKPKRSLHRTATHGDGHHEAFRVLVTTWNMGDAKPPSKPFDDWFFEDPGVPTDIIAVGVQEGSYESQRKGGKKLTCDKHWHEKIGKYLNEQTTSKYKMVAREVMLTMSIVVFVREDRNLKVENVKTSQEATGIGHVVGNKGGVMVSFSINGTAFCFISSHLAAHQGKIAERNRDYREIVRGLDSGNKLFDATNLSHFVYWMGDLNYRIDEERGHCIDLIKRGDLAPLLEKDQLLIEHREGRVFCGFEEADEIRFNPTYKFAPGTIEYAEEKARVPSWCDRILVKHLAGCRSECLEYDSVPTVRTSDHIPVIGYFEVTGIAPLGAEGPSEEYSIGTCHCTAVFCLFFVFLFVCFLCKKKKRARFFFFFWFFFFFFFLTRHDTHFFLFFCCYDFIFTTRAPQCLGPRADSDGRQDLGPLLSAPACRTAVGEQVEAHQFVAEPRVARQVRAHRQDLQGDGRVRRGLPAADLGHGLRRPEPGRPHGPGVDLAPRRAREIHPVFVRALSPGLPGRHDHGPHRVLPDIGPRAGAAHRRARGCRARRRHVAQKRQGQGQPAAAAGRQQQPRRQKRQKRQKQQLQQQPWLQQQPGR